MDSKGINSTGLAHLWNKIKTTFATKQYVQNAIAGIGGGGGGEGTAVQEIYYADFTVDFQNYAITGAKTNYQTIVDNIEAGKYIVGRGTYAFVSSPENIGYFPLTAYVKEQNMLIFSGFAQAMSGSTLVLLSLTIEVPKNNTPTVRARLISTTDLH